MMAKGGTLRSTTPPSKNKFTASLERSDNKAERAEVLESANRVRYNTNYRNETAGSNKRMSKRESIDQAAYVNDMKRKNEGKSKY
jgi:hypothetical protein